jgi:hypothetical protein
LTSKNLSERAEQLKEDLLREIEKINELDTEPDTQQMKNHILELTRIIRAYYEHYSEEYIDHSKEGTDCPTWYDGCHCTTTTIKHLMSTIEGLGARIQEMEGKLE